MDNDLIIKKNWWGINWKWLLPLTAFILACLFLIISEISAVKKEPKVEITFDKTKWLTKDGLDYPYRNKMLQDLIINKKLKKLKKEEILELLGQPDRIDSAYLFYRIAQQRLQFFPLHTKTLVIKLTNDDKGNSVMIHE